MNNDEKYINLSEIIKKLKLQFLEIERDKDKDMIRIYHLKGLMFNVYKKKIVPMNIMPFSETKWFYKLWVDDYIVVDDMKEECEGDD